MDTFERKLVRVFEKEPGFDDSRSLMVALSGGADSVALLVSLCRLSRRFDIEVQAAHVNHGVRGEESDADEQFVGRLCGRLGVHLAVGRLDDLTDEGNLEERMRIGRYRILYEVAGPQTVVATAHHADDQAETLLLKLARGAGLAGLSGIYPRVRDETGRLRVIRPLLSFRRAEILGYLERQEMSFRTDSSNASGHLDRNWVRQALLPRIVERLNRRAVEHMCNTATLAREAEALMKSLSAAALEEIVLARSSREVELDLPGLRSHPLALRRRLLKDSVGLFKPGKGPGFEQVDSLIDLLESPNGHRRDLPGGLVAVRQGDRLAIKVDRPARAFSYLLSVPGEIHIESQNRTLSIESWEERLKQPDVVKFGCTAAELVVRNRRTGDTFYTRSGHRRKLKKLLNDQHIPSDERDRLIVVVWGETIVWVEKLWPHPKFVNDGAPTIALRLRDETFDSQSSLK